MILSLDLPLAKLAHRVARVGTARLSLALDPVTWVPARVSVQTEATTLSAVPFWPARQPDDRDRTLSPRLGDGRFWTLDGPPQRGWHHYQAHEALMHACRDLMDAGSWLRALIVARAAQAG